MKQPIKGNNKKVKVRKKVSKSNGNRFRGRNHAQGFGTSKLEQDFARDFLDKIGLKYVYEYEAKSIKRYFDFAVTAEENYPYKYKIIEGIESIDQDATLFIPDFLIEIDGDYFHSNPKLFDESKLNPMQRHNKFVDKLKDQWCALNCIPLLRIWENDIRNNPKKVFDMLEDYSAKAKKKQMIRENKRKPH